ncbi:MAG: PIN domain-containing protein [Flavobacterium sp.]|nr:PIN domain-containing protein [Pedobacter sp.]
MKSIFLDSDVLLDALLNRAPFNKEAIAILELLHNKTLLGFTSSIAFINIHYFLGKKVLLGQGELDIMKKLKKDISTISIDERIIDYSLESRFSDFEVAVQYYAAKSVGCECIVTRNSKHYKHAKIPVLNAEQLINLSF